MSHEKTTQFIKSCAESFLVATDNQDIDRWSAGLTMAKALDTLVDDDHIYNSGDYAEELLAGGRMPHTTEAQGEFIREAYTTLSPESQSRWRNSATQLGAFALKRLEAVTIHEYISVVSDESQLMSDVLMIENDIDRPDAEQRTTFNGWIDQMARTAYLADTLSDFVRDYNEGNMNIRPTITSAAVLARHVAKEGIEFARTTPAPVYIAIARRAISKSFEKIQQPNFLSEQLIQKRGES